RNQWAPLADPPAGLYVALPWLAPLLGKGLGLSRGKRESAASRLSRRRWRAYPNRPRSPCAAVHSQPRSAPAGLAFARGRSRARAPRRRLGEADAGAGSAPCVL